MKNVPPGDRLTGAGNPLRLDNHVCVDAPDDDDLGSAHDKNGFPSIGVRGSPQSIRYLRRIYRVQGKASIHRPKVGQGAFPKWRKRSAVVGRVDDADELSRRPAYSDPVCGGSILSRGVPIGYAGASCRSNGPLDEERKRVARASADGSSPHRERSAIPFRRLFLPCDSPPP